MTSAPMPEDVEAHNEYLLSLGPLDHNNFPFTPIPSPRDASAQCTLSLIQTGVMSHFPAGLLAQGEESGALLPAPSYAFLIEKQVNGEIVRVVYEMGLREPSKHTNPLYKHLDEIWKIETTPGVAAILESNNVPLESISCLVLGHAHFDHIGNLADLPRSVTLIVGPGSHGGAELAAEMDVVAEEITERNVRQLSRETDQWVEVGAFRGLDYFGDGSFWILDVPGHKAGHVAGLVRTSTNPPVYHVLGSDTTHTPTLLSSSKVKVAVYPESILDTTSTSGKLTSIHADLAEAYQSIAKMRRMDLAENINVCLAHDPTITSVFSRADFIKFEGTMEELVRLKGRDRTESRIFV